MQTKWKKLFSFGLAFMIAVSAVPITEMRVQAQEENSSDLEYEIYPVPREISYDQNLGTIELSDAPNLIIEDSVDDATKNRLHDILEMKGIEGTESGTVVSGKTNILVGVKDSEGAVDTWFAQNVEYPENHFEKVDSYVLAIQDNVIAVLGKDTDAAFYGLSTLKLIVEQTKGRTIRKLQVNDYASGQYRGFIEGYYGIPWSVDDRISLMEFGGDFKMNIYIFAPKDDPYHNSHWREPYPAEQLEDIKRMVEAGAASKCRFAWAIHPFMQNEEGTYDPITLSNYEQGLADIQAKFQSLYNAGVRQFVISADDASSSPQLQANLCRDMIQWVKEHDGCYNLCFVPMMYCTATQNWGYGYTLSNYFNYFSGDDFKDLEIMWTGESVCSQANQSTCSNFKNLTSKEPFLWMNWPVNDVNHKRLVMGPAENVIYQQNLANFKGLVTNPLEQAEASKTSLFATADFAWNTTDFSCFESWEKGFSYIDSGAPEALHEICKHLTNPSPGGITTMGESTELASYITNFTTAYDNGNGTNFEDEANALIEQLQIIVKATDDFQSNGVNENLKDEMKPWVDSLRYLSKACIGFIEAALELQSGNGEEVFENYLSAFKNYKASQLCEAPQLTGTIAVESGAMKIMPFAATMNNTIKANLEAMINENIDGGGEAPSAQSVIYDGLGRTHSGRVENVADGNDSTYVWFNKSVEEGAYIGLDLKETYRLDAIRILQGKNETDGDVFSPGILECSLDNENWTPIGTYSGNDIRANVFNQFIMARYIRLRTPGDTGKWYAIREFSVTVKEITSLVYTNAETYREYPAILGATGAAISEIEEDIVLNSGEYIGLELPCLRELTSLEAEYTNRDKLLLEYSCNGFDWMAVADPFQEVDARFVRIVNKGDETVSFHLTELSVQNGMENKNIIAKPEGKSGNEAVKAMDNSLVTSFEAAEGSGSLIWSLASECADELYIIQDPEHISNAKVQIRTNTKAWVDIGTLNKSRNLFDIYQYGFVNEVRITWEANGPVIYEICTKTREHTNVENLTTVLEFAKTQEVEGFTEESFAEFKEALAKAEEELKKPGITEEEAAKVLSDFYQAASKLETVETPDLGSGETQEPGGDENKDKDKDKDKEANLLKVGDTTIEQELKYRVTNVNTKEVAVCGVADAKKKNKLRKITILGTVKVKGESCKVTSIDNKAFSAMKKLKTVIIGENVKSIGKKAFFNNKKLKKITIKSQVLTTVPKNAFKKSASKGTIKVPKSKKRAYTKLFKKCTKMKVK